MNNNYKVVYSGLLKSGTDVDQFVRDFTRIFKTPEAQARKLVTVGRMITLKDNLEQATAEKYRQVMDSLGMQVHVEVNSTEPQAASPASATALQPTAIPPTGEVEADVHTARCPKCGSERVKDDDCLACGIIISRYNERQARSEASLQHDNPYAAPQSDVTVVSISEFGEMNGPHSMPAGNGWSWIASGWSHFSRNPFAWIGAVIVWMILMMAASVVPFIGSIAINLLAPVFTAGFLLGADEQHKGGNFEVRHLFAGFSGNTGGLVLVGLFYMLGTLIILVIAAVMAGGALITMSSTLESGKVDPQTMMMVGGPLLLALLVAMALWIPLMMAYWFAPALVVFEGIPPFAAMKLSFAACLKNILPYLIYSIILLVLMMLSLIPFGLGLIVMIPVMMATMYTSFRDIFYETK